MRRLSATVLCATLSASYASAANVGVSGGEVLSIEQGSRGIGMGGAFTSVVDDAESLWWNPAGLARQDFSEVTLTHTVYVQNVSTEYLGLIRPLPQLNGTLGASLTYLSVPGVQGYDQNGVPTSNLAAYSYVGSVSYGSKPINGVTLGATAKYVSQTLSSEHGTGFAADLGAQYRQDHWGLGAVIQNIGPSFSMDGVSDPLPRDIRIGGFYRLWNDRIAISLDEEKPYDQNVLAHLGAEWTVNQALHLRGGIEQTSNAGAGAGITVGFGYAAAFGGKTSASAPRDRSTDSHYEDMDALKNFWSGGNGQDFVAAAKNGAYIVGIDYAFTTDGTVGDENRVSLSVRF
jgi:hypothetical protein